MSSGGRLCAGTSDMGRLQRLETIEDRIDVIGGFFDDAAEAAAAGLGPLDVGEGAARDGGEHALLLHFAEQHARFVEHLARAGDDATVGVPANLVGEVARGVKYVVGALERGEAIL